jgi:DNA ligase-1
MTLPQLFKLTSKGAVQFWEIRTEGNVIVTRYGQAPGKVQTTRDVIKEGKNLGRANATTAEQQAELEAQSKWEAKKKKGYVEKIDAAKAGERDAIIEGGIDPMLAHPFSKHGEKIVYPCLAQPKLDGIRCIAMIRHGKCTLWSRTRKPIISVPHIVEELEKLYKGSITLDGELYNHDFKENFEHITHIVGQKTTPDPKHKDVQYHVYDVIVEDLNVAERLRLRKEGKYVIQVSDMFARNEPELASIFRFYRKAGYEGAMARNIGSKYEHKRSYNLQKIKEFDDAEYEVVGVVEGRGKLAGHAGSFTCVTADGTEFEVKMSGDTAKLREYFLNPKLIVGKLLTVQFQGLTGKNKVPRFPVGLRFREE